MKILVTNDDGIDSNGIEALVHALIPLASVTVIAPDRQQSAVGHALTVSSPLRTTAFHRNGEMFGFAVNGTPADCVKLAVTTLLDTPPDLIVSGINHGSNTAINVLYSGTVSAATEGMILGVPSIAVSLNTFDIQADCRAAAHYAALIVQQMPKLQLPKDTLLNVNIPYLPLEEIRGVRVAPLSSGSWDDRYERRKDPMGRDYYWLHGHYNVPVNEPESDDMLLRAGYVVVSPIRYDLTNREVMANIGFLNDLPTEARAE